MTQKLERLGAGVVSREHTRREALWVKTGIYKKKKIKKKDREIKKFTLSHTIVVKTVVTQNVLCVVLL